MGWESLDFRVWACIMVYKLALAGETLDLEGSAACWFVSRTVIALLGESAETLGLFQFSKIEVLQNCPRDVVFLLTPFYPDLRMLDLPRRPRQASCLDYKLKYCNATHGHLGSSVVLRICILVLYVHQRDRPYWSGMRMP